MQGHQRTLARGRGRVTLLLITFLTLSGCGGDEPPTQGALDHEEEAAHPEEPAKHPAGEAIRLDAETLREFEIDLEDAGPGPIEKFILLPAEIRPNQDRLAHIAPRFPGTVREVRARLGDTVKAGQVLAIVESEALAPYPLKTLIPGVIIQKHITRGEPVSREQIAFVVADLRDVWVDISVYQKDLPFVRVGLSVEISAGHGLQKAQGKIFYVSPIVGEATRTATARVVLPNSEGTWQPGLFVTARILAERTEATVAVPKTALQEIGGRTVVFVQEPAGFVARPIRLGRQGVDLVEVVSGLSPGERYVARGGFTLKAELSRAGFSGGHGH